MPQQGVWDASAKNKNTRVSKPRATQSALSVVTKREIDYFPAFARTNRFDPEKHVRALDNIPHFAVTDRTAAKPTKGVLEKSRKFQDAYYDSSSSKSSAHKRVMDFFRRKDR